MEKEGRNGFWEGDPCISWSLEKCLISRNVNKGVG